MTFTNLSIAQIREFWNRDRPLYLEIPRRTDDGIDHPRRLWIYGVRTRRNQFQVLLTSA